MANVSSVRGLIQSSDLGPTLMHEHIVWLTPGIRENWPDYFDEDACIAIAERKLNELATRGIRTIVDLTPPDAGRDIKLLKTIQALTPINIIPCTGIYGAIGAVPAYWIFKEADDMAAAFIQDIHEGIQGSEIAAGIIKLATDILSGGLDEVHERCLRAGARAHRATGIPISTHTGPAPLGLDQQRVFLEEGVDLTRVIIGHVGDSTDTDLHKRLMDAGSTIGMDRFGIYYYPEGFDDRVNSVVQLCSEGYADRMILSHDHWCWHDWDLGKIMPGWPWEKHTYTHISDEVLPALREKGVSDEQIDQMLVENPRRIFETEGAY